MEQEQKRTELLIDSPEDLRREREDCRKFTQSLKLLDQICSELDITSFTIKDIRETFNARAGNIGANKDRYGPSNLEVLEEMGVIQEHLDSPKRYFIVQDSPIIIQREMNDYSHFCEDF